MNFLRISAALVSALVLAGCATGPRTGPPFASARASLKAARSKVAPFEERAAHYLEAAQECSSLSQGADSAQARAIYNQSAAELTQLLRSADAGAHWSPAPLAPLRLATGKGTFYLSPASGKTKAFWAPGYFTRFVPADQISEGRVRAPNHQEGLGGALVGVRAPEKREPFAPRLGIAAPVTSTLEFEGNRARIVLHNPVEQPAIRVHGKEVPLHADYSAPLAIHPPVNELLEGFRAMIRVEKYMPVAGLYFIEPYDPDKIPLIFVHGLMSTGHMWLNVANEIKADPELRRRYQVWVFSYPTGNPIPFSALRFREELARVEKIYAPKHGYVLVGHSMGGLLSRMQATNTGRMLWNMSFKRDASRVYAKIPSDNLLKRMLIFRANPKVDLLVFICVPHRGSDLAVSFGGVARKIICLPTVLTETVHTIASTLGDSVALVIGKHPLPTSVDGLSPRSSTLLALDKLPIQAPFHSIMGDRGRGDTPNSSDGIVPYWSSHLDHARSELIVPGSHSAYEMPQTIAEIKRILREHLKSAR